MRQGRGQSGNLRWLEPGRKRDVTFTYAEFRVIGAALVILAFVAGLLIGHFG